MSSAVWRKALEESADPARARHFVDLLAAVVPPGWIQKCTAEQARVLGALFGGSNAQGNLLVSHPEWLSRLEPHALTFPRRKQGLRKEMEAHLGPLLETNGYAAALGQVRRFKEKEMLRMAARDLVRIGSLSEIIREISDVADVCLESVWRVCLLQLTQQYGQPHAQDDEGQWQPVTGAVIGLGKLGGQELNYSSDVDVVIVYREEGQVRKDDDQFKVQSSSSFAKASEDKKFKVHPPSPRLPPSLKLWRTSRRTSSLKSRVHSPQTSPLALTNHQFFNRLVQAFVAELTRVTPEGTLYRIDLRLRPEGDLGPLSRSLEGYENYYAQWGQTWERMMLIKARCVAGDEHLASEFLEMIQPFRYPRSINSRVLDEVAAMKDRIENEVVKAGELERNVKLGRGGIREIEFIVQSLQLIHAGRQPFLQSSQTLPCLEKLAQYELLPADQSRLLAEAYVFLREVEHRLQMEDNRQTHTIPRDEQGRLRLAKLMMGYASNTKHQTPNTRLQAPSSRLQKPTPKEPGELPGFERALKLHTNSVRAIFDSVLKADGRSEQSRDRLPRRLVAPEQRGGGREAKAGEGAPMAFPSQFAGSEKPWTEFLTAHRFRDAPKAVRLLREFVEGPGYVHVSQRTSELALQLLPRLFELCSGKTKIQSRSSFVPRSGTTEDKKSKVGDPRSTLMASPARAAPRSTLHASRSASLSDPDRVVTRLDSFIGAYGARSTLFELWNHNPALFELLVLLFDRSEFLAELAIRCPDLVDELVSSGRLQQRKRSEETLRDLRHGLRDADQHLWLRRYHQAELMRIGLRDILSLADFEQYLTELSALAVACLQYALEAVMRRRRLKTAPITIIGLGKLGGAEIDYGSDLDVVFVAGAKSRSVSDLVPVAAEVLDLLTRRTELGIVFHTDARLRPDGEKGLLVNTLGAYQDYYLHRAQLWEIQTLTRARFVAGDIATGKRFEELAAELTNFARPRTEGTPAAYSPDWKVKIHNMRMRIERERTPPGKDALAIKTGSGGLMDAEFVAQRLCMEHGWRQPNTLQALELGRAARSLPNADQFISSYRQLRRVEGILRRWSYEGETVLPEDPAPFYRVSVRCGFETPAKFRSAIANWRRKIRGAYARLFDR